MNFPRTLLHEGLTGAGAPLVTGLGIDSKIADKIARFSFWCCQPAFLWKYPQRQAIDVIRAKNPAIKILAHFVLHSVWGTPGADQGYQSRYAEICARPNGVYPGTHTPNLCDNAIRGACIDLWDEVYQSGAFDGVMLDPMCAVQGLAPLEQQRAALGSIMATLRYRCGSSAILIGCGGPAGDYPGADSASGWWQEAFPNQNPVGWTPVTRLCMDASFRYTPPTYNVIAMARSAPDPQAMRFGLGTSCLFDGVFAYGPGDWKGSAHLDWVIPEYFPNGWLGRPLGVPWVSGATWTREFEGGSVVVDTMKQDAAFTRRV